MTHTSTVPLHKYYNSFIFDVISNTHPFNKLPALVSHVRNSCNCNCDVLAGLVDNKLDVMAWGSVVDVDELAPDPPPAMAACAVGALTAANQNPGFKDASFLNT